MSDEHPEWTKDPLAQQELFELVRTFVNSETRARQLAQIIVNTTRPRWPVKGV